MTFGILKSDGRIDKPKTNRLKKQIKKSCDKIRKTIFEEVTKVHELSRCENLSTHFWGSLSYHAFLHFSQNHEDVYVSAEIADLFGSKDLNNPTHSLSYVDIDRLNKARIRELEKRKNKRKK